MMCLIQQRFKLWNAGVQVKKSENHQQIEYCRKNTIRYRHRLGLITTHTVHLVELWIVR